MITAILATAAAILGFFFCAACGVIIEQGRDINELEQEVHRLSRELESANTELEEMRCEYERSMGGTDYRWRPVNRVFGGKPR